MPQLKVNDLPNEIQNLMHYFGLKTFTKALMVASLRASKDTKDFEDGHLTQNYKRFAKQILDIIETNTCQKVGEK